MYRSSIPFTDSGTVIVGWVGVGGSDTGGVVGVVVGVAVGVAVGVGEVTSSF